MLCGVWFGRLGCVKHDHVGVGLFGRSITRVAALAMWVPLWLAFPTSKCNTRRAIATNHLRKSIAQSLCISNKQSRWCTNGKTRKPNAKGSMSARRRVCPKSWRISMREGSHRGRANTARRVTWSTVIFMVACYSECHDSIFNSIIC